MPNTKNIFKIAITTVLLGSSCYLSAYLQFNRKLEKILECKQTTDIYHDFYSNFDELLKQNGWKDQGFKNLTSKSFTSKKPIIVFGMQTKEIGITINGIFAVYQNREIEPLAQRFQISQHPFFKDKDFFSGEKVVHTDPATDKREKTYRKLTLMEILSDQDHPQEVYLGCQYMTDTEQKQLDERIKAWGE